MLIKSSLNSFHAFIHIHIYLLNVMLHRVALFICDKLQSGDVASKDLGCERKFWGEFRTDVCWGVDETSLGGCRWCVVNMTNWTINLQKWFCSADASLRRWGEDSLVISSIWKGNVPEMFLMTSFYCNSGKCKCIVTFSCCLRFCFYAFNDEIKNKRSAFRELCATKTLD